MARFLFILLSFSWLTAQALAQQEINAPDLTSKAQLLDQELERFADVQDEAAQSLERALEEADQLRAELEAALKILDVLPLMQQGLASSRAAFEQQAKELEQITAEKVAEARQALEQVKQLTQQQNQCRAQMAAIGPKLARLAGYAIDFDLLNKTPADFLVPLKGERIEAYAINALLADWLRGLKASKFKQIQAQSRKSHPVRGLQQDMIAWAKDQGLVKKSARCAFGACPSGLMDSDTKDLATRIFKQDPSFFPGARYASQVVEPLSPDLAGFLLDGCGGQKADF